MALTTKRRRDKEARQSLESMSDQQVRGRIKDARQAFRELAGRDPAELARTRQLEETTAELLRLADVVTAGEHALQQRQRDALDEAERRLRRGPLPAREPEKRIRAQRRLRGAFEFVARREHGVLGKSNLKLAAFSNEDGTPNEEGLELVELVRRMKEFGFGLAAEPLSDEELSRYEALVGIAAGDPQLFERKREEAAARAKAAELADELKVSLLEPRPRWEEAGSVTLPRYAVHGWLLDDGAREGDWTLMDLGLLVAVLSAFENRDPAFFVGARFEGEGDERTLVVPGGVGSDIRLYGMIAGSSMASDGAGHVRVRTALATLARNDWIAVERSVSELRIRLGVRVLKLRESRTAT